MAKPFDIEDLLAQVAAALEPPLTPETDAWAALLTRYFAALNAADYQGIMDLLADDFVYYPPRQSVLSAPLTGKEAFRDYLIDTSHSFLRRSYDEVRVYPLPNGRAARYTVHWETPDSTPMQLSLVGIFTFTDNLIRQFGFRPPSDFGQPDASSASDA